VSQSGPRVALGAGVLFGGLAIAMFLFFAGMIFGLNGKQWGWWVWASWAGALLVLFGAVVGSLEIAGSPSGSERRGGAFAALSGAVLVVGCLWLMAHRYSDPYSGDLFWPHALAVLALIGLALAVIGLLVSSRREHSSVQ
jgi:NADH:ubiquinone oxidoreductase subunit 6 (subunit J)